MRHIDRLPKPAILVEKESEWSEKYKAKFEGDPKARPDNSKEVEFTTGAVYQYYDVSQSIYDGLMAADSHGTFLSAYVKKGGYRYAQV